MLTHESCCAEFSRAQRDGSDNEGWCALMGKDVYGGWIIGDDLPPIRYCPWCGKPVTTTPPTSTVAI